MKSYVTKYQGVAQFFIPPTNGNMGKYYKLSEASLWPTKIYLEYLKLTIIEQKKDHGYLKWVNSI